MLRIQFKYSISFVIFLGSLFSEGQCFSQIVQNERNPYPLGITHTVKDYESQVGGNRDMQMTNLATKVPDLVLDIRYATTNNFTGKVIYASFWI